MLEWLGLSTKELAGGLALFASLTAAVLAALRGYRRPPDAPLITPPVTVVSAELVDKLDRIDERGRRHEQHLMGVDNKVDLLGRDISFIRGRIDR